MALGSSCEPFVFRRVDVPFDSSYTVRLVLLLGVAAGIGFKSVFLVTAQPYVISNGYRVRFQDTPHDQAGLGYIVPEWAHTPTDVELSRVYGKERGDLPTTTLVLPLRDNKVEAVKKQLKKISAETILFLSQVCTFTVREDSNGVSQQALSITRETVRCLWTHQRLLHDSTVLLLLWNLDDEFMMHAGVEQVWQPRRSSSSRFNSPSFSREKCNTQVFFQTLLPVAAQLSCCSSSSSGTAEECRQLGPHVSLPAPRSHPGRHDWGFVCLPPDGLTTGFPFLVNADFLLASSRETMLFNNPWNMGILGCISEAFSRAFLCLLHNSDNILGSLDSSKFKVRDVYKFVPAEICNHPQLEEVRHALLQRFRDNDRTVLVSGKVGHRYGRSFSSRQR
jgi:sacsin